MKANDRSEAMKTLNELTAHMKSMAYLDPDSVSDVAVEAMGHIIEHFIQPPGQQFAEDFCLVFFNAHMGRSKTIENEDVLGSGIYLVGNENRAAHWLAEMMKIDQAICRLIFHAVAAYNMPRR